VAAAIAELQPAAQPAVFLVHPANLTAVRLFQAMATQWNMVAISTLDRAEIRRVGLRYEVLDRVAKGLRLEEGEDDFQRVQVMEAEALVAWAEARP